MKRWWQVGVGMALVVGIVALGRAAPQRIWPEPAVSPGGIERVTGLVGEDRPGQLGVPTVVRDGARYRAWYVSRFGPNGYAVHHAESADGKRFRNPVVCFSGNRAPCRISGRPVVFKVGGGWRMLLTVYHAVKKERDAIVAFASEDGLRWRAAGVVASGSDDCRRPAVVKAGREWWLFYERLERDERPARSRYYRLESKDGDTWGDRRSLLRDRTRAASSSAATLHAWYDRSARRWCLLSSEPRSSGRFELVLRLSEDGRRWKEDAGIVVALGRDRRATTHVDMHAFLDDGGRWLMYWGRSPTRIWRERVDLGRLVRDAVRQR